MDVTGSLRTAREASVLLVWDSGEELFLAYNGTNTYSLGAEGE